MRLLGIAILLAAGILALLVLSVSLVRSGIVEEAVRDAVARGVSQALGREVEIRRLWGDPWRGVVAEEVRIARGRTLREGSLLRIRRVRVEFHPQALLQDLLWGPRAVLPTIRRITLVGPVFALERDRTGRWNLEDLFRRAPPRAPAQPGFTGTVTVVGGSVEFVDAFHAPPFRARLEGLSGSVFMEKPPLVRFSLRGQAVAPSSAPVAAEGWVRTDDGALDLEVRAEDVAARSWGRYLAHHPRVRWEGGFASGRFRVYGSGHGRLDWTGHLRLREVVASVLPEGVRITVTGPVRLTTTRLRFDGVQVRTAEGLMRVVGEVLLADGGFIDLEVATGGLDARLLRRLALGAVPVQGRLQGRAHLVGPPESPRFSGHLRSAAVTVDQRTLRSVESDFAYGSGLLALSDLQASILGGDVHLDLLASPEDGRFLLAASLDRVPTEAVRTLGLELPVRFRATGLLLASGSPRGIRVRAGIRGGPGEAFGMPFRTVSVAFDYADDTVRLEAATLEHEQTWLGVWGTVSGSGQLDLFAVTRNLPLGQLGDRLGVRLPLAGVLDAAGRVTGTLQDPRLVGHALLRDARVGPIRFDAGVAAFALTRAGLRLAEGATVREGQDVYRLSGEVRWGSPPQLDLRVQTEGADVARLRSLVALPVSVTGEVSGSVRVTGTPEQPQVAGEVELRRGSVAGQSVHRARAQLRWDAGTLVVEDGEAFTDRGNLRFQGKAGPDGLGLTFSLEGLRLEAVGALQAPSLRLAGNTVVTGALEGTLRAPVLRAAVRSEELTVNGVRFGGAGGEVTWRPGLLLLHPFTLLRGAERYTAEGAIRLDGVPVLDLRLRADPGRLGTLLQVSHSPLFADGSVTGALSLQGPVQNPAARLDLRLTDGHFNGYPIRSAVGVLELQDRRVTIRSFELTPRQGTVRAQGTVDLKGGTEVEVSGEGIELNSLRPVLRLRTPPLEGTLDFTLQLSGTLQAPVAGLSVEGRGVGTGEVRVDRVVGQAFYREGTLFVEQLLVEQAGYRARASGQIPLRPETLQLDSTRPLRLRAVTDRTDLGLLARWFPQLVESASGELVAQLDVSGTTSAPRTQGFIQVGGGNLRVRGVLPALEGIAAQVRFDDQAAQVDVVGRLGQGTVRSSGEVTFRAFRPDRLDLSVTASGARLEVPAYRGLADAELRLVGPVDGPELRGRITLRAGEVLVAFADGLGDGGRSALPLRLNLELLAGQGLTAQLGQARFGLGGRLRVTGSLGRPELEGTVAAREGELVLFGRTFWVESASAQFRPFWGTTPQLTARARTQVGDVAVTAHIEGTPQDLQVRLVSDPPLPPEQIAVLLAGEAGLPAVARGDVEALVRQQLSRLLLGELSARVRRALGLRELRIEYDFERPLRLHVGGLLVQNLYLTLTTTFTDPVHFLWSLEYRFSPTVALALTYDTRNVWLVFLRSRFVW